MFKNPIPSARKYLYAGIFSLTAGMLLFQMLLTRLFSVIVFYHFAFLSISLAMFGIAFGAVLVHRNDEIFSAETTERRLCQATLTFGWSAVITTMLIVFLPLSESFTKIFIVFLFLILGASSVTFTLGGIALCLLLTRYTTMINRLYAADLVGSACGALTLLIILPFMNGPTVAWFVLLLAGVSALCFAKSAFLRAERRYARITILFSCFVLFLDLVRPIEESLFALHWAKGQHTEKPIYERWNAFSQVRVLPTAPTPYTWGLSSRFPDQYSVDQLHFIIDASASTPITRFTGSLEGLDHLKADVVNVVHYLRHDARVFVVGVGGGRDLLTGLLFNQQSITGAEVNPNIINPLLKQFSSFSGNLLLHPKIKVVNDEARSYIARHQDQYDIIQISLIDTWAALASGAFSLTENSLYTVEAWKQFISKLSPNGILSVSRWWKQSQPAESLRIMSLAKTAMKEAGIQDPSSHIAVIVNDEVKYPILPGLGVATLLLSKSPLSDNDALILRKVSDQFNYKIAAAPFGGTIPLFEHVLNGSAKDIGAQLGLRLDPPYDDSPFFFYFSRLQDVFTGRSSDSSSKTTTLALVFLILFITSISYQTLVRPLLAETERSSELITNAGLIIFFIGIGLGYMFVEISLMQWFAVFLGHPTYGITVTLCTLLMATGAGSFFSHLVPPRKSLQILLLVSFLIAISVISTPYLCALLREDPIQARIALTIALLIPIGVSMGMGFPIGMRLANTTSPQSTALLWAINGAASVCAGPIALLIAISSSIWISYWCGFFCYLFACGGYAITSVVAFGQSSNEE